MSISDPHLIALLNQFAVQAHVYSSTGTFPVEDNIDRLDTQGTGLSPDQDMYSATTEFETPIFHEEPTLNEKSPLLQQGNSHHYFQGGCHCQSIRFVVFLPETERLTEQNLIDCNCSICTMKGFIHWTIPFKNFALYGDPQTLSNYQFNTRQAQHLFCSQCGVAPFYLPRSHPNHVSVNVRCLDDGAKLMNTAQIQRFNGQEWEVNIQTINAAYPIISETSSTSPIDPPTLSTHSLPIHRETVSEDYTLDESISDDFDALLSLNEDETE